MAKQQPTRGKHRLRMDGEWDLLELSGFGRQYVQVYSILYAFQFGADRTTQTTEHFMRLGRFPGLVAGALSVFTIHSERPCQKTTDHTSLPSSTRRLDILNLQSLLP